MPPKILKIPLTRTLCLAAAVLAAGCGRSSTPGPEASPTAESPAAAYRIVSTIGMVHDIVARIAGDRASVTGLVGTGVDPHLYKPTRNDVAALMNADIIFYCGLMLEGKMADSLIKVAMKKPVYAVTEQIPPEYILEPDGFSGHADPHLWMDVRAWMQAVEAVVRALSEFDPAHAGGYRANADGYLASLEKLHAYAEECISSIPVERRVLITAHDAFNYFSRAYGIEVVGIQGISTESSAGLEDIRRIVDLIVQRNITAVFVESSVPDKNVRALIEGAAARNRNVVIGGELYSDAMGSPGTYEGTYIGMIDHNVTVIARALGGEAPPGGMNGRLSGGRETHLPGD